MVTGTKKCVFLDRKGDRAWVQNLHPSQPGGQGPRSRSATGIGLDQLQCSSVGTDYSCKVQKLEAQGRKHVKTATHIKCASINIESEVDRIGAAVEQASLVAM